mmetsp:Transcript_36358/g.50513  ORF Transcript_36358/g.50513 Transcript_36358/m.50513 type:complete len:285 (+) Transcript_36358:225-1079(+)
MKTVLSPTSPKLVYLIYLKPKPFSCPYHAYFIRKTAFRARTYVFCSRRSAPQKQKRNTRNASANRDESRGRQEEGEREWSRKFRQWEATPVDPLSEQGAEAALLVSLCCGSVFLLGSWSHPDWWTLLLFTSAGYLLTPSVRRKLGPYLNQIASLAADYLLKRRQREDGRPRRRSRRGSYEDDEDEDSYENEHLLKLPGNVTADSEYWKSSTVQDYQDNREDFRRETRHVSSALQRRDSQRERRISRQNRNKIQTRGTWENSKETGIFHFIRSLFPFTRFWGGFL